MNEAESRVIMWKTERGNGEPEAVQRRWFCVALAPSGTIFKGGAESAAGLSSMLGGATIGWVDFVTHDFDAEVHAAAAELGFSKDLVSALTDATHSTYQDFDTEMGMKLPSVQVRELDVLPYPLLLLMRKNFILTIHPLNVDRRFSRLRRYAETVLKKIPVDAIMADKLTMLLTRIIDENNDRNFEHLREIEELGDKLNESMIDPNVPRAKLGPDIYHMKHALIVYLNSLWDTVNVLHSLRYGDAELISDDPRLLDKLGILAEDVNRQIGLAEHMSEVLASGLEVLQSIYNNQLQTMNNRLTLLVTYFTVLGTAFLVPNTIATALGDPVFDIGPKDLWWYLSLMIGSTLVCTVLVFWWVRNQGFIGNKSN
ncbi:MAG: CorA family divalent cation transporter [Dehalococcoidia bacterium]|nr:CorA family divalent cation transporter [Dehalococcoidia bacterium]